MLQPRIIPFLLIHQGGLVKTTRFSSSKYVGDPLNAVRIFNEKQVDELIVADMDATVLNAEPDYSLIQSIASECRMPLCYIGGVKTVTQVERIVSLGVEKVGIGACSIYNPEVIQEAALRVGSQSIVSIFDIKKTGLFGRYEIFTHNGKTATGIEPVEMAIKVQSLGAGEILCNSIDRDGTLKGYDFDLINTIHNAVTVPLSVIGGAGSLDHMQELIDHFGLIGASAGSMFVFKGKYRAVLIQYPNPEDRMRMSKLKAP